MAIAPPRELKTGKVIDKSLAVIERNIGPVLAFVVVITALCVPVSYVAIGSTSISRLIGSEVLRSVISMICSYFLLVAMLRRTNLFSRTQDAFLPFIGLTLLSSLGTLLGFIALVLPGIFIMARWILAPQMLVARDSGVMQALGDSWERTRGNEFQIIFGTLLLLLPLIAIGIAISVFLEADSLPRLIVGQIASTAATVVFLSVGVALYGLMGIGKEAKALA